MAVLKCKMCGGELAFEEGATVCECEYCGSKQTIPNVDDEKKMNLFNRANRLRLANEFDKAAGVFESIAAEFPEEAEAYWGLCLCQYGIEYVDDPATAKKVPTCHRTSYDGIFEEENFQMALEYADPVAHRVYREEAKEIDRLQKAILEVASKEEPFDVFICYKETGEDGQRTKDSVLAQDMYDALTGKGYKVFFSRITLEDKLGMEYEPYIFAALNSAKVMLVLGTRYEHFNAIWVKNEWARFLELMKKDKSKVLIPCYCDIDAYDMPPEFKNLQGQDMGKIGFMQDLVRGIEKIIPLEGSSTEKTEKVVQVVQTAGNPTVDSLLKRVFMFLEDGDWNSANEYSEKVLDIEPENAQAYLGKLMADLHVKKQDNLKDKAEAFDNNSNYKKAVRFADDNLKTNLAGHIEHINARNNEAVYKRAQNAMAAADTENAYKEAAKIFETVSGYKDAAVLAQDCYKRAEEVKRKAEEETSKCRELFNAYKAAVKCEKDGASLEQEAKKNLKNLNNRRQTLQQLSKAWNQIETEFVLLDEKIKETDSEIAKLNNELSNVGFFNGKKKKELSEKIEAAVKERNTQKQKSADLEEKKEGFSSLAAVTSEIQEIEQQIQAQNKSIEEMSSAKSSEAIREELSSYPFGRKLLSNYDKSSRIKIGDSYTFGSYGNAEIEWQVIDRQDSRILVISKYGLDSKPYNEEYTDVTWESCTLRRWLNNDFIREAFSKEEIAMIPKVKVSADKNPKYDTNPGNATQDQVFLLSIAEANKYFGSSDERQCKPTDYAVSKKVYVAGNGNCYWWLRSPGGLQDAAAGVGLDGAVAEDGYSVSRDHAAVRPALWIDLES